MKVLYLSASTALGGAELSLLQLIMALPRERVEPVVALPRGEVGELPGALTEAGIEWREFSPVEASGSVAFVGRWKQMAGVIRCAREIEMIARTEEVNLLHANTWKAALLATGLPLLSPWYGRPLLLHHRDAQLPLCGRLCLARRVTAAVAVSGFIAGRWKGALPQIPVETIPSGVDLSLFHTLPSRAEARLKLGLPESATIVLGVLNHAPWKGRELFHEAVKILSQKIPGVVGMLLGRDVHRPLAEIKEGDGNGVLFLPPAQMPSAYAAADVLLHTARDEPFGRVIVEALAAGISVVATRGGGPEEILKNAGGARFALVDQDDAPGTALALQAILAPLGVKGAMRAEVDLRSFDVDTTTRRLVELYQRIRKNDQALDAAPL